MVNSHMISITSSYEVWLLTVYNNFIHAPKQNNHYCAHYLNQIRVVIELQRSIKIDARY